MSSARYHPTPSVEIPDRRWPSRRIEHAPVWCSVDLRDGNQALIEPMGPERKGRMFRELVHCGFKEIEISFPSAAEPEYAFTRQLIEEDAIPEDVTIQVLSQAREPLIRRTFDAVRGARRVIFHVYGSTSTLQRRVVFGRDRAGTIELAVDAVSLIRELAEAMPETEVVLEYSPESFTGTELDFAVEICESVMDVWEPTPEAPMILNLPATVEMTTPNVYADQIEWFGRNLRDRERVVLSVHPHNDRGTAVAAAELALMAGADRVEGTLLGNGERTGNVDVVTLALNMLTQGVEPGLDFSDVNRVARVTEYCNRLPVPARHPYVGDLVFTAFSGSHQDAIQKGLAALAEDGNEHWEVPYLPIDPADVGRHYEPVIRLNSQSGKGGVAYVMEQDHGMRLPRRLLLELSRRVQQVAESSGEEVSSDQVWEVFSAVYMGTSRPIGYLAHHTLPEPGEQVRVEARVIRDGVPEVVEGVGNGPLDAFLEALRKGCGIDVRVSDYSEHAVAAGAEAEAAAYVEVTDAGGRAFYGVGRHPNLVTASLLALVCAINRSRRVEEVTEAA